MSEKEITIINADRKKMEYSTKKIKVAAYCRVSTKMEIQTNSLKNQIAFFTAKIKSNPDWDFAGVYFDYGVSGRLAANRKGFISMLDDCEKGKIDMILTKSVSRFARNTVESLKIIRNLTAKGIAVYFEEMEINTLTEETELMIGCFSVIAQAESENISKNIKWGIKQRMKKGIYKSNFECFGYRKGSEGVPEIVPEQAEAVKCIFDSYLNGYSLDRIGKILSEKGVQTFSGKSEWSSQEIQRILMNEKYVGDLLLQKTYTSDSIEQYRKVNNGEKQQYLIENNHPAIIDRAIFDLVQTKMKLRSRKRTCGMNETDTVKKYSGKYALSDLLVCAECGAKFKRNGKTTKDGCHKYYWRCAKHNAGCTCKSVGFEEEKLQETICKALSELFPNDTKFTKFDDDTVRNLISAVKIKDETVAVEV